MRVTANVPVGIWDAVIVTLMQVFGGDWHEEFRSRPCVCVCCVVCVGMFVLDWQEEFRSRPCVCVVLRMWVCVYVCVLAG